MRIAQAHVPSHSATRTTGSITSHVRYGSHPAVSRVMRRNTPNTTTLIAANAVYAASGCGSASIPTSR